MKSDMRGKGMRSVSLSDPPRGKEKKLLPHGINKYILKNETIPRNEEKIFQNIRSHFKRVVLEREFAGTR